MDILTRITRYLMWLAPLLPLLGAVGAFADERQYKIEAAFLYNFFNYITWPSYNRPEDLKDITLCIEDGDVVTPYLDYIRQTHLQNRSMTIRSMPAGGGMDSAQINGCHLLFVHNMSHDDIAALRPIAIDKEVLLVSDTPDFVADGGMIGLARDGERITVDIDNTLLKRLNFAVSSRLLNLARQVQ